MLHLCLSLLGSSMRALCTTTFNDWTLTLALLPLLLHKYYTVMNVGLTFDYTDSDLPEGLLLALACNFWQTALICSESIPRYGLWTSKRQQMQHLVRPRDAS